MLNIIKFVFHANKNIYSKKRPLTCDECPLLNEDEKVHEYSKNVWDKI